MYVESECGQFTSSIWQTPIPALNSLRPRQTGRHFPDDIFKCVFLNENVCISLKISLKFVTEVRINNIPALVQIMAWRLPGDKPLSEPMMVNLLTHICVTRPQWVNRKLNRNFILLYLVYHVIWWHLYLSFCVVFAVFLLRFARRTI